MSTLRRRQTSISLVVILCFLIMLMPIQVARGQTPPPDRGDWVIEDDTLVEDQDITVYGSIVVEGGGSLTLRRCSVHIHCTVPGQNAIMVREGGRLLAEDTTFDANIDAMNYEVQVEGYMALLGCDLRDAFSLGVRYTGNSTGDLIGTAIHDNGVNGLGVMVEGASRVNIEDCDVYNNMHGIGCTGWASVAITGTSIHDNYQVGLYFHDYVNASIYQCTIRDNVRGVEATYWSMTYFDSNLIFNHSDVGIAVFRDSMIEAWRNTIHSNSRSMDLNDNTESLIHDNYLHNNSNIGLGFSENAASEVYRNRICRNGDLGIIAENQAVVDIHDNDIYENVDKGISLSDDTIASVRRNNVQYNLNVGIYLDENAVGDVSDNLFEGHADFAVRLDDNASADLEGNAYRDNRIGVLARDRSILRVEDESIESCMEIGVQVQNDASAVIQRCSISNNGETGVQSQLNADGVLHVMESSISGNYAWGTVVSHPSNTGTWFFNDVFDRNAGGIAVINGAKPIIENCTISNSTENAVYVRDVGQPSFYNCTIENSYDNDLWLGEGAKPLLVATPYDREKTFFNDTASVATSGWWVDVLVRDEEGRDVSGARVSITDIEGTLTHDTFTGMSGLTSLMAIATERLMAGGEEHLGPFNLTAQADGMAGSTLADISGNTRITIILRILPDIDVDRPDATPPGDLILSFLDLTDGELLGGSLTIRIRCSIFIDTVQVYMDRGGTTFFIGESWVLNRIATVEMNTSDLDNGRYTLRAVGENRTSGLNISKTIDVYVDNPRAELVTTLASVGIATLTSVGAASIIGGASVKGGAGLEDLGGEYLEERLFEYERGRDALPGSLQAGLIVTSGAILAGVMTYSFYSRLDDILLLFAYLLVSVSLVIVAMEAVEHAVSRRLRVRSSFNLWPVGLLTLVITTFLLRLPLGTPGKTKVHTEDRRAAGLTGLAMLLTAPALLPLFVLLIWNGYYWIGVVGGYTAVMLLFVDGLPVYPLEGKRLYDWNKGVWVFVLLLGIFLLLTWQQLWMGYDVFMMLGVICLLALVLVATVSRAAAPVGVEVEQVQ